MDERGAISRIRVMRMGTVSAKGNEKFGGRG